MTHEVLIVLQGRLIDLSQSLNLRSHRQLSPDLRAPDASAALPTHNPRILLPPTDPEPPRSRLPALSHCANANNATPRRIYFALLAPCAARDFPSLDVVAELPMTQEVLIILQGRLIHRTQVSRLISDLTGSCLPTSDLRAPDASAALPTHNPRILLPPSSFLPPTQSHLDCQHSPSAQMQTTPPRARRIYFAFLTPCAARDCCRATYDAGGRPHHHPAGPSHRSQLSQSPNLSISQAVVFRLPIPYFRAALPTHCTIPGSSHPRDPEPPVSRLPALSRRANANNATPATHLIRRPAP